MSTVTTTKRVDLAQLAADLGGPALSMTDDGTSRTITGDLNQAALQAAIDAHVEPPDPATLAANRHTVETALADALTSLRTTQDVARAIGQKVNADIGPKDTKDIARELVTTARVTIRLCRAALGKYDGND